MQKYNAKKIEAKWQKIWQAKKVFQAKDSAKSENSRPKKYILVEFPYPSGAGLHMGHLRPYVAADVYSRFQRVKGFETLFPIGWDAFGLPAENYAIKMGVHPSKTTAQNIKNAKKQMQSWGLSFDWSREVNTTDPGYYKWTQWLFLQFYKKGLAYEATGLINWCPKDKTGLANEEVIDGKCERCGTEVEKKELRQWYLKITAYAEKLLEGLKTLNEWPDAVKLQQENWIGKKTGINITYNFDFCTGISGKEDKHKDSGSEAGMTRRNYVLLHGFHGTSDGVFFPWLKKELEKLGLRYQAPDLPNTENPKEEEQINFVLQNCTFDENTVILGHSLGAVVAMKVLEKLNIKIAGLVMAGGFSSPKFRDKQRPFHSTFNWEFDYSKIKNHVGFIQILSDPKDYAVRIEQGKDLHKNLGGYFKEITGKLPHYTSEQEPEILQALVPNVTVFTTRPDTNFGATFVVLGPEHPLLADRNILGIEEKIWQQIKKYQEMSAKEGDQDRTAENRKKTGVFTGLYLINTLNNYKMPLYVADYVLGNVGTGAVVGVPGHDKRDFEFAQAFNIPVIRVVQKDENDTGAIDHIDKVQEEEGKMVNSEFLNGMDIHKATEKIMDFMEEKGYGKRVVNYKLRDWVFSRQRYWGEPIPIIHCRDCGVVPVPEKDLPVKLPPVKKYEPTGTGESPLAAISKWVNVKCPVCKSPAKRETNTMPQWAGSSWYWLRYTDPKNKKEFASIAKQKYWTPVDVYFGGMEHTTLHLLYSRFWNLFLYDQKLVTQKEPYKKRFPHGIILGPDGEKMSKSRGNVVNPQDIVQKYGADVLRMFELFLGPHADTIAWNDQSIVGIARFLDRVWNWVLDKDKGLNAKGKVETSEQAKRALHKLIKKITQDIENFSFNTSIAAFMEFYNKVKEEQVPGEFKKVFLQLLNPFAPHISEELNFLLGNKKSLQQESWPVFDPKLIVEETVEIVVQINGKVKGKVTADFGSSEEDVKKLASSITSGQNIRRTIFVPNRLINFVV